MNLVLDIFNRPLGAEHSGKNVQNTDSAAEKREEGERSGLKM